MMVLDKNGLYRVQDRRLHGGQTEISRLCGMERKVVDFEVISMVSI
jgi:hypothetical protein